MFSLQKCKKAISDLIDADVNTRQTEPGTSLRVTTFPPCKEEHTVHRMAERLLAEVNRW